MLATLSTTLKSAIHYPASQLSISLDNPTANLLHIPTANQVLKLFIHPLNQSPIHLASTSSIQSVSQSSTLPANPPTPAIHSLSTPVNQPTTVNQTASQSARHSHHLALNSITVHLFLILRDSLHPGTAANLHFLQRHYEDCNAFTAASTIQHLPFLLSTLTLLHLLLLLMVPHFYNHCF